MLEQANLDVPAVLPETKSFAAEPDFLASCLSTVVPQMVASGLTVDDPSTFCALMHVERTGLMPRGSDDDAPAAPPEMATDPLAADPLADPMARNAGPVRPQAGGLTQPPLDPPPLALETVPTQPIVEPAPPVAPPLVEPPAAVANVPTGPPTIGKPHKKKNLAAGPTPIGKPV